MLEKTQFDWHDDVKHLIKDTKIELLDKNTFKITAVYEQQADWDEFNKICWKSSVDTCRKATVVDGSHLK